MTSYRPAQIFAAVTTAAPPKPPKIMEEEPLRKTASKTPNFIHVSSTGELSLAPDRCKVTISVNSVKDQVQEVKNSVSRRLDYILQTLHNHQIKEGDIDTAKVLSRTDGLYQLTAEVTVQFLDCHKFQAICNLLVEKLSDSIKVSPPEFYHAPHRLENLRRQASMAAIKNAKLKAAEMAGCLQARLGQAISIEETAFNEWQGPADAILDLDAPVTIQQRMDQAQVHVHAKVSASFELRPKKKVKDTNQ